MVDQSKNRKTWKDHLIEWSKIVGGAGIVIGVAWQFLEPRVEAKLDENFDKNMSSRKFEDRGIDLMNHYVQSSDFKLLSLQLQEEYEKKQILRNSANVKLRTLLAAKMECDEDEVHINIGELWKYYKDSIKK